MFLLILWKQPVINTEYKPSMIVADAGYRTPAIAHELIEDGIDPLFPYKRPMTKDGFFKKHGWK